MAADGSGRVYTLYAHASELLVKVGDSVRVGDLIMKSGNTGSRSKGPHLHYEVIKTNEKFGSSSFYNNLSERYNPGDLLNLLK